MRKRIIILGIVLAGWCSDLAFCQQAPLLISVDGKKQDSLPQIDIQGLSDTIKIFIQTKVIFSDYLNDTILNVNVIDSKIMNIFLCNKVGGGYDILNKNNYNKNELYYPIWKRVSLVFYKWIKNQPYNKMINRDLQPHAKAIAFIYKVYLVPAK